MYYVCIFRTVFNTVVFNMLSFVQQQDYKTLLQVSKPSPHQASGRPGHQPPSPYTHTPVSRRLKPKGNEPTLRKELLSEKEFVAGLRCKPLNDLFTPGRARSWSEIRERESERLEPGQVQASCTQPSARHLPWEEGGARGAVTGLTGTHLWSSSRVC